MYQWLTTFCRSNLYMDFPLGFTDAGRNPVEYPGVKFDVSLLVLDCGISYFEGWIHVPDDGCHLTTVLHHSRSGESMLSCNILRRVVDQDISQAVAAMSPDAEIGALLFAFLFSFVIIFQGVLQPFSQLGWWKWMYHVSPFTYLTSSLLGQGK